MFVLFVDPRGRTRSMPSYPISKMCAYQPIICRSMIGVGRRFPFLDAANIKLIPQIYDPTTLKY